MELHVTMHFSIVTMMTRHEEEHWNEMHYHDHQDEENVATMHLNIDMSIECEKKEEMEMERMETKDSTNDDTNVEWEEDIRDFETLDPIDPSWMISTVSMLIHLNIVETTLLYMIVTIL